MTLLQRNGTFFLALAALLVASLACNMPETRSQAPANREIPISTESVENLEATLETAAGTVQAGQPVTVVVTETQMTTLVAGELQNQTDPVLSDPQIYLRDGQIQVHGNVHQSGLSLPISMNIDVSVDEQGQPEYEVASANLGPLPLPQSVLDQIEAQVDRALAGYTTSETNRMIIHDITIADGEMTITGQTR